MTSTPAPTSEAPDPPTIMVTRRGSAWRSRRSLATVAAPPVDDETDSASARARTSRQTWAICGVGTSVPSESTCRPAAASTSAAICTPSPCVSPGRRRQHDHRPRGAVLEGQAQRPQEVADTLGQEVLVADVQFPLLPGVPHGHHQRGDPAREEADGPEPRPVGQQQALEGLGIEGQHRAQEAVEAAFGGTLAGL
jgi:hypothetical protein